MDGSSDQVCCWGQWCYWGIIRQTILPAGRQNRWKYWRRTLKEEDKSTDQKRTFSCHAGRKHLEPHWALVKIVCWIYYT